MQWPSWATFWRGTSPSDDNGENRGSSQEASAAPRPSKASKGSWDYNLNRTDWSHYTTPQTITFSVITAAATLLLVQTWKTYLRRIPTAQYLKPGFFRRRNIYGRVTRVGDGDNFHVFHTPGGKMMGWGWLPGRRIEDMYGKAGKKNQTIHVRIAGIDAPELAHFGRPEQPYAREAIDWLKSYIYNQNVRAYPFREDQYKRVVCAVYKRRFLFFKSDVGLQMLKQGLATVYEAKFGSEFGDKEQEYRDAEKRAKAKKIGMWAQPGLVARILGQKKATLETPREYKTRMAQQEKNGKTAEAAK